MEIIILNFPNLIQIPSIINLNNNSTLHHVWIPIPCNILRSTMHVSQNAYHYKGLRVHDIIRYLGTVQLF